MPDSAAWTLAGSRVPLVLATTPLTSHRDPISAQRVRALVDAAADAGFAGVSIWADHHDFAVADGMASDEYFGYHEARRLSVPASEVILEWAHPELAASADNARIIDISARAGASTVIVASLHELGPLDVAARGLAELCDRAGERGLGVSLEFIPFGGIPTVATALRLIEAADRENLGLVLDVWHWSRQPGGPDFTALAELPPERLHILQLNDAAAEPADDLLHECANRLLPGHGDADIAALLAAIGQMGAAPVVISEVFSQSLAALDPAENALRQYAAAAKVLWGEDA